MQQPQPEAPPEVRKMAQPVAAVPRRGSAGGAPAGGQLSLDEGLLGPQPPQSLGLQSLLQPVGPKKKSGFQITSVTPAQASASLSSNNSIAEDTESYDDLDESHTEELSSSEILDASLSRATDLGAPGRSSSEETLSNLQEADTPGALSPNQPRLPGLPTQVHPLLINGTAGLPHPEPLQPPAASLPGAMVGVNMNMMNNLTGAVQTAPHPTPPGGTIAQVAQAVAQAALGSAVGQQGPPPITASAGTSRFRVVKLDSSSEPFRKGRWTCTEFYEREQPAEATHRVVESVRQAAEERESTSESSASSTLSHYTESAGSGEGPGPQLFPEPQSAPQPGPSHSQDGCYGQQKQAFLPSVNPSAGLSMGTAPTHQQQTPYPQPVQTLSQQLQYAAQQQISGHISQGHAMPSGQTNVAGNVVDYLQHTQILQPSVPVQSGIGAPGHNLQVHIQSTAAQAQSTVPSMTAAHAPTLMPAALASSHSAGQQVNISSTVQSSHAIGQPVSLPVSVQSSQNVTMGQSLNLTSVTQQPQPSLNQGMSSVLQHSGPTQSTPILQQHQTQGVHMVPTGLPQQVALSSQNTPMSTKHQAQGLEPVLQGINNSQIPVVSPMPPAAAAISQANLTASVGLASAPVMAQPSNVHNGAQGVTHLPASLPGSQHVSHQIPLSSAQFFAPSLIQSVANQIADARRLMEHSVSGLPQAMIAEGISGIASASSLDGSGSSLAGSVLPLKTLPLVDGEDDSSSGASVVAIDNKIEQAMDLVKSHLMYAVREEVEVLKEQIKELIEKNSQLEQENSLLKTLASPEQMAQFQAQLQTGSPPASSQPPGPPASGPPGTA
ncbi:TSC22 domain family protein 1 [Ambystoma mexicanum]|uniref:TSC22 domain family protein 1 n=1 Tax=Ambystoma mexicanum TaxID=8296 RepID=UPI0037E95F38